MIEKWLKGWSLSRGLPLPVKYKSGFKVDVGYEKQKTRYVFPELNEDFIQLSKSINESWVFLKVCASPEKLKRAIPEKWVVQPQGYMMACLHPMNIQNASLSNDYKLKLEERNSTFTISIITKSGELASIGNVILVDDMAIYDSIKTDSNHRKKGLATFVMKELEDIALSKGVSTNFLVATEAGKRLYQYLGWELYSLYTSVVIPAHEL